MSEQRFVVRVAVITLCKVFLYRELFVAAQLIAHSVNRYIVAGIAFKKTLDLS